MKILRFKLQGPGETVDIWIISGFLLASSQRFWQIGAYSSSWFASDNDCGGAC